jgi:hypothetical protein
MLPLTLVPGLLLALAPLAAVAAGEPAATTVDKKVPYTPEGRIDVDGDVGAVHVGQVVFQNLPTENEVREASRPGDTSRPQPMLVVTNAGPTGAKLEIEVALEDDQGQVLMSTEASALVAKGKTNEVVRAYRLKPTIRTIDWPKLKVVHVVVKVSAG